MRGYLIEIACDPKNVGKMNTDDYIVTCEGHAFAEWYEEISEQRYFRMFQEKFSKYGATFGEEDGIHYMYFTKKAKRAMFAKSYEQFMKEVGNMTLDKFASGDIYECESLLRDPYGDVLYLTSEDAVYLTDEEFAVPIDQFIRMVKPRERYYIGNIFLMH